MNFHHLHVVDYDGKCDGNKTTATKQCETAVSKKGQNNENNNKRKPHIFPFLKRSKTQQSKTSRKQQEKTSGNISKTKVDHVKDSLQKKSKRPFVRTLSVDDIGKRLQKCDSNRIKQKIKNRLKMRKKDRKKSQDDIKVLYTSQRFGEEDSNNRKKPIANVYKTQSSSRLTNNVCLYYQACACKINKRLSKTNLNTNNNNKLKSDSDLLPAIHLEASYHDSSDEMSLSLPEYSKCRNCEVKVKEINNESLRSELIKEVAMGKSISAIVDKGDFPDCKCKNASTKTSSIINQPMPQQTNKIDKQCGCRPGRTIVRESNTIVANFFKMLLVCLKYFLLSLTVIAWSPCIIVSFACWFVISPLTPDEIRADEVVPACMKCGNSFFSRLVECVTRKYMQIAATFDAMKQSFGIGREKHQISPSPKCYSSKVIPKRPVIGIDSQPCIARKYVLFHSQQRGWLMKPMRGQHNLNLPNQICSVYPALCGKHYRNKKSVSFWDSEVSHQNNKNQRLMKKMKCSSSCVYAHKPPTPSSDQPVVKICKCYPKDRKPLPPVICKCSPKDQKPLSPDICECSTKDQKPVSPVICECFPKDQEPRSPVICKCHPKDPKSLPPFKCTCPVTRASKAINTPDKTSSTKSHHSLELSSERQHPHKRKIYGACPHHRPAPQRPIISQSEPEISETPREEDRMRRRSSSPPHKQATIYKEERTQHVKRTSSHRERQPEDQEKHSRTSSHRERRPEDQENHSRTSSHRERRPKDQEKHSRHPLEKRSQTEKSKPAVEKTSRQQTEKSKPAVEQTSRRSRREKSSIPQKDLKLTYSVGVQKKKPSSKNKKTHYAKIKSSKPSKSKAFFQRMKADWDFDCKDLYLTTLTKKPCFWIYKAWPHMYPFCLTTCKIFENCCTGVLFICSACVWCPIFLCCYLCYYMICDCMCSC